MPSKLRKSAALFLFSQSSNFQMSKILMLQRKKNMSFGSLYVAPGGVCDNQDKTMANSTKFSQYGKITSIRQMLEETGILVYPSQIKLPQLKSIQQITTKIGQIWENNLNLIQPLLRLITPQIQKGKRYDCFFYGAKLGQKISSINIGTLKQNRTNNINKHINKFDRIIINETESQNFIWDTPKNILAANKQDKNRLGLAPPQIIILKCLLFINKYQNLQSLQNYYQQPIQFYWKPQNKQIHLLLSKDSEYRAEQIIQNQQQSQSKHDFIEYQNKLKSQQTLSKIIRRIIVPNFQLQTNQQQKSLIAYLPRFRSQSIQPKL